MEQTPKPSLERASSSSFARLPSSPRSKARGHIASLPTAEMKVTRLGWIIVCRAQEWSSFIGSPSAIPARYGST
jgi:hypothetical protein